MLLPSGNPFKCHEEVLYFQLLIPPKRFDFSPLTGGCSERLGAFRFFFKKIWFDDLIILMFCDVWRCMAININVQYNGGLLPDIILLTQGYYHRGTRLNTM